jgi:hypothetical protein
MGSNIMKPIRCTPYSLKAFQDYQSMPRGALILHLGDLKSRDKTNKLSSFRDRFSIFTMMGEKRGIQKGKNHLVGISNFLH